MKLTEKTKKKLVDFMNFTIENASEEAAQYIIACLCEACSVALSNVKEAKNGKDEG